MPSTPPPPIRSPHDLRLLFASRVLRLAGYGFIATVLVLYLSKLGLHETQIGLLLTLTYLGDALISLWLTTRADQSGRRRTLCVGAWLMIVGGAGMALTGDFFWLVLAATIGVISPSGNEVGPFLAIEQAGLAHIVADRERTRIFAWYHVAGFTATAGGSLLGGLTVHLLQNHGLTALASYRALFWAYAVIGVMLLALATRLTPSIEATPEPARQKRGLMSDLLGLHESKKTVLSLSALFSLDAFAGGFIVQSFVAYWFYLKFGVLAATLGAIFFGTSLLSGLSALVAVPLAKRIGLVNTMVWTHLPSNVLLLFVPVMPSFGWAVGLLLVRHLISQMDVPTRQSYVNAVVPAGERSAANGVTTAARQFGLTLAPLCAGPLLSNVALSSWAFWICGTLKIAYDLLLWRRFRAVKPPEEQLQTQAEGSR